MLRKQSDRSMKSMVWDDLEIRSAGSTFRKTNNHSGFESNMEPTPYNTAAICLHMPAESGQEHFIEISLGLGNNPDSFSIMTDITDLEKRP